METSWRARGPRVIARVAAWIGVAGAGVMLLAGSAEARPLETAFAGGASIRNGDWVAVDGLGVVLLGSPVPIRSLAVVARGEVGLGGVSAGLGLALNSLPGQCRVPGACTMSDLLWSGMISLEARVARMYGPTSWRNTTYAGGQLSLAGIICKPSLGWMVDVHDPRDRHYQIATGVGW